MADVDLTKGYKLSNDLEVAPVRNLDDFLLTSARFQVPQYNDTGKWSNRIVCNLLYYQTNYAILAAALFLMISLVYPRDIIIGCVCIGIALSVAFYFTTTMPNVADFKKQYPFVGLGLILIGGLAFIQMVSSMMVLAFSLAFPLSVVFVHASLRLRNVKNKIVNKAEAAGVTKTVMGRVLDILGMKPELRLE